MFWFTQGLCFLPVFLVIWSSSTFIVSYIIALFRRDVDIIFPYIRWVSYLSFQERETLLFWTIWNSRMRVDALFHFFFQWKTNFSFVFLRFLSTWLVPKLQLHVRICRAPLLRPLKLDFYFKGTRLNVTSDQNWTLHLQYRAKINRKLWFNVSEAAHLFFFPSLFLSVTQVQRPQRAAFSAWWHSFPHVQVYFHICGGTSAAD